MSYIRIDDNGNILSPESENYEQADMRQQINRLGEMRREQAKLLQETQKPVGSVPSSSGALECSTGPVN